MTATPPAPDPAAIRAACASVADPEFGVGVDDLGLIYDVALAGGDVAITMTLTTPHCPAGDFILQGVRAAVSRVPGVSSVAVRLVWDPRWTPNMISSRGRRELGWA